VTDVAPAAMVRRGEEPVVVDLALNGEEIARTAWYGDSAFVLEAVLLLGLL